MSMEKTKKLDEELKSKSIPAVCSVCNKIYRIDKCDIPPDDKTGVSYGICAKCFKKQNG